MRQKDKKFVDLFPEIKVASNLTRLQVTNETHFIVPIVTPPLGLLFLLTYYLLGILDTFFQQISIILEYSVDVFYGTRTLKSIDYSKNN